MGIRTKIEGDFKAVNLASMADDMLAQVVTDHAAQRFTPSNRANAIAAKTYLPYTVAVDGRTVSGGKGEMFAQQPIALAVNPPGRALSQVSRRLPVIIIDWAWDGLQGSALDQALAGLVRVNRAVEKIEDPVKFARKIAEAVNDPAMALLKYMLLRYARGRFPVLFQTLGEVKALYRVYRLISLGADLLTGDKDQQVDPSVLAWIAGELRSRSPVLSGEYRDAHELWADGSFLMNASAVTDDSRVPNAKEFSFTNTMPYARKIEFGKTESGRAFVIQVPNHLYENLAKEAAQRFRGIAEIFYEMRAVIGTEQTPQRRARRPHNKPDVRYPSIVVRF